MKTITFNELLKECEIDYNDYLDLDLTEFEDSETTKSCFICDRRAQIVGCEGVLLCYNCYSAIKEKQDEKI